MLSLLLPALLGSAQAATILSVDASNDRLVRIDTATQVQTVVGALGFAYDFGDAAYDAATGTFYIIVARPTPALYAYNINTGVMTLRGTLAVDEVFAAGFDPATRQIFAVQNSTANFYRMDPSNGAMTMIANSGVAADGGFWDATRGGLVVNQIAAQDFSLIRPNGTVTHLGTNGNYSDNNDFDLDPATGLIWSYDWSRNWRSIDNTTYAVQSSGTSGYSTDALAIVGASQPPPVILEFTQATCPGPISVSLSGFTPNGNIGLIRGTGPGTFTIPSGGCAGTMINLAHPAFLRFVTADAAGNLTMNATSGPMHCGMYFQAVDMSTCRPSTVDNLP